MYNYSKAEHQYNYVHSESYSVCYVQYVEYAIIDQIYNQRIN